MYKYGQGRHARAHEASQDVIKNVCNIVLCICVCVFYVCMCAKNNVCA